MKIDKVVCHKCGAVIPAPWVATSYHELEAKLAISEARVEELEKTRKCKLLGAAHKLMTWQENRIRELEEGLDNMVMAYPGLERSAGICNSLLGKEE